MIRLLYLKARGYTDPTGTAKGRKELELSSKAGVCSIPQPPRHVAQCSLMAAQMLDEASAHSTNSGQFTCPLPSFQHGFREIQTSHRLQAKQKAQQDCPGRECSKSEHHMHEAPEA